MRGDPAFYDQIFDAGLELDRSPRHALRYDAILARIPSGTQSVLDAGCGDGALLTRLRDRCVAVGVDFSLSGLRRARGHVLCARVDALPFESRSFDLVHAGEVLEHLTTTELGGTTREMARVAREWCLVTVPNRERLRLNRVACPSCGSAVHPHGHLQSFDATRLATLVPGFNMTSVAEVGNLRYDFPAWLIEARRLLRGERTLPEGVRCPVCAFAQPGAFRLADEGAGRSREVFRFLATCRPNWLLATFARVP